MVRQCDVGSADNRTSSEQTLSYRAVSRVDATDWGLVTESLRCGGPWKDRGPRTQPAADPSKGEASHSAALSEEVSVVSTNSYTHSIQNDVIMIQYISVIISDTFHVDVHIFIFSNIFEL